MKIINIIFICTLAFCISEARAAVSINGKIIDSSQPIIINKNNTVKNLRSDLEGILTSKKNYYINRIRNKKFRK